MKLDITLSINKKQESSHNTFLLKWNPAISSYTMERLNNDMAEWADGYWSDDFDWSVFEWQKARCGDRFFMARVGEGNIGVFAAGRFTSEPFRDEDWSGKGREVYYMKMEFEAVFHPDRAEIITAVELEGEFPTLNWRGGHSGEMLDAESAERLELMWRDFLGRNKVMFLPRAVKNPHYDLRSDIDKAIEIASRAHAADYDLDGNPTILHPLAVGMMGQNDTERIVGFLHDVVEDTSFDFDDLVEEGFSEDVIEALHLLTHDKETPYMTYIERICNSGNTTALNVKINDLRHNLARGKEGGHTRCVEKHTAALAYIEAFRLRGAEADGSMQDEGASDEVVSVRRKPIKCPKCNGRVVPIVYGLPTASLDEQAQRGVVVLGGCCINEESPEWACIKCNTKFRRE